MKITRDKNQFSIRNREFSGKKIGLMGMLFGCWHRNLSRPFTYGKDSYRVCLNCGARKNFNAQTLTTSRSFYYPPNPALDRLNH